MSEFFTPRQVSRALGVSESSLKRWCDRSLLKTVRTAGGHRRVPYDEIARFCRDTGRELVDPAVLGLPAAVGHGTTVSSRASSQFGAALIAGEEVVARRLLVDLYLTKHSIPEIGDLVIAPALREIGDQWHCGDVAVWQERRGCEIVQRVIYELTNLVAAPPVEAPFALGGTLEGDPYRLSTMLCEATLREAGWHAESLGTSIPAASLAQAIVDLKPRLCWISISHIASQESLVAEFNDLSRRVRAAGIALAVGGRAVDEALSQALEFTVRCTTLHELRTFAAQLLTEKAPRAGSRKRAKKTPIEREPRSG